MACLDLHLAAAASIEDAHAVQPVDARLVGIFVAFRQHAQPVEALSASDARAHFARPLRERRARGVEGSHARLRAPAGDLLGQHRAAPRARERAAAAVPSGAVGLWLEDERRDAASGVGQESLEREAAPSRRVGQGAEEALPNVPALGRAIVRERELEAVAVKLRVFGGGTCVSDSSAVRSDVWRKVGAGISWCMAGGEAAAPRGVARAGGRRGGSTPNEGSPPGQTGVQCAPGVDRDPRHSSWAVNGGTSSA